MNVVRR